MYKVRFVASTLLDAVQKAETAPASAARAHAYLCASHGSLWFPDVFTLLVQGIFFPYCLRSSAIICEPPARSPHAEFYQIWFEVGLMTIRTACPTETVLRKGITNHH